MKPNQIIELYRRDLNRLKDQIDAYTLESNIWKVEGEIINSSGTLCLHLVGNLNHFIGSILGDTGYVRDRHAEFNDRDIPKEILTSKVNQTIQMVERILLSLSEEDLAKEYPRVILSKPSSTFDFIIHLYGHLNYHLGQINYHRRLLDVAK